MYASNTEQLEGYINVKDLHLVSNNKIIRKINLLHLFISIIIIKYDNFRRNSTAHFLLN